MPPPTTEMKTWEAFCRKKAGYHHESSCGSDNACPHCGLANPNPTAEGTAAGEEDLFEIPRFPSPPARRSLSAHRPFSMLQAEPANQARQHAIHKTLREKQMRAHAGSPAHSQRPAAVPPSSKGKNVAKKSFRVVIALHVGYLVDECFGRYSDWETISMYPYPK
jgi:hypothetical protein